MLSPTKGAYNFVFERTHGSRALKLLTVVDEYTRERLAIEVDRSLKTQNVLSVLAKLFLQHVVPAAGSGDGLSDFSRFGWNGRLGVAPVLKSGQTSGVA